MDIAIPQPCMEGCPAFATRKMAMATAMPASPTSSGSVSLLRTRSSPTSNSRLASSPTTRKNSAINPEFTNSRTSRDTFQPPTVTDSRVAQNLS